MTAPTSPSGLWPEDMVRRTAGELVPELDRLIAGCAQYIGEAMPELDDDELVQGLIDSAGDNFRVLFAAQRDGIPLEQLRAPRGAIAYADIMVRRGVPLATLLRAYRFGVSFLFDTWRQELRARYADADAVVAALDTAMQVVFDYVDRVCDEVAEAYASARERWNRSAAALRAETAKSVLAGEEIDVESASQRLGYALRRHHVALVLRGELADDRDVTSELEQAAQWVATALGCPRPLLVPRGMTTLWVWIGTEEAVDRGAIGELAGRRPQFADMIVGCGEPAEGVEGFRRSHAEAEQAAAIGGMTERPRGRLVRYEKVVVPSLLLADRERARAFVARELGPLAGDDDAAGRVRATLAAFLEEGSRAAQTARRLGIHQNTVAYRLHQAEELLGHPINERRFEVEAAMRLLPLLR